MPRDNHGNIVPIGFNNKQDFLRTRDGVRAANRANMTPATAEPLLPQNMAQSTQVFVRITDDYNEDAKGWPAVLVFNNLEPVSMSDPIWADGEKCMAFSLNDERLTKNRRYDGQLYGFKKWTTEDPDDEDATIDVNSMFVLIKEDSTSPDCPDFVDLDSFLCLSIIGYDTTLLNKNTIVWTSTKDIVVNSYSWSVVYAWDEDACCPTLTLSGTPGSGSGLVTIKTKWMGCIGGAMKFSSKNVLLTGADEDPVCGDPTVDFYLECSDCTGTTSDACNGDAATTFPARLCFTITSPFGTVSYIVYYLSGGAGEHVPIYVSAEEDGDTPVVTLWYCTQVGGSSCTGECDPGDGAWGYQTVTPIDGDPSNYFGCACGSAADLLWTGPQPGGPPPNPYTVVISGDLTACRATSPPPPPPPPPPASCTPCVAGVPDSWSVPGSGFTGTDCDAYNSTFTVPFLNSTPDTFCLWHYDDGEGHNVEIVAFNNGDGTYTLELQFYSDTSSVAYTTLVTDGAFDCCSPITLSRLSSSCDTAPATIEITPSGGSC